MAGAVTRRRNRNDDRRSTARNPSPARTDRANVPRGGRVGAIGLNVEQTARQEDLRTRRKQAENATRSLLALDGQSGPFIQSKFGRLDGDSKTLNYSITEFETASLTAAHSAANLADVSAALKRLDPILEVLIPDKQERVLILLIEKIVAGKHQIEVAFRTDGVTGSAEVECPLCSELLTMKVDEPMGEDLYLSCECGGGFEVDWGQNVIKFVPLE